MGCVAVCCSVLQCVAACCSVLQCVAVCCSELLIMLTLIMICNVLQHTATHCTTLQHTAIHCNTLQHTATHCNTLQHTATQYNTPQHAYHVLQRTATHCNTIQHTATQQIKLSSIGSISIHWLYYDYSLFLDFTAYTDGMPDDTTGWRRPIGCLKLQDSFRKRATNYRALLRQKMYQHKASYASSPPCTDVSSGTFSRGWRRPIGCLKL